MRPGGAEGLFTLMRLDDPLKAHVLLVVCDLCKTGEGFDERLARPTVEAKIGAITRSHVCTTGEAEAARIRAEPKKKRQRARTWNRFEEVTAGTLRKRLARQGFEDDVE